MIMCDVYFWWLIGSESGSWRSSDKQIYSLIEVDVTVSRSYAFMDIVKQYAQYYLRLLNLLKYDVCCSWDRSMNLYVRISSTHEARRSWVSP